MQPSWRQSDKRTCDACVGQEIVFKNICLFRSLEYFKEQFTELLKEDSSVEKSYYSFIVLESRSSNLVRNTSHAKRGFLMVLQ